MVISKKKLNESLIKKILLITESWYSISHVIVLLQLTKIMPNKMRGIISKLYFSGDLLSSVFSYYVTRKNKTLVTLHFLEHLPVILHIFNILPTYFYKNVFKIAYNNLNNVPRIHYYIYNMGTILDIFCHIYNIKYLYKSLSKIEEKKIK
jgi:hypothetical protein